MGRVHAFTDDALGDLDAVALVEALGAGRVTAAELVDAAIARTERVEPELAAVAHTAYDQARERAARRDREPRGHGGWFAGVPTFVKDNVDVAGWPTQHGTDAFPARPAKRDGDFVEMFLGTGLVPLGKTRLSEYGFSPAAEHERHGAVRSPWSTEHTAGASSAGSAALVAAGAVPLAHANDGGGSIRIPASVNGLVGLKPTRDRLAQDALHRSMPVRIVADGVVTRTVRDTAAFLREAERQHRALSLPPIGDVTGPSRHRLRVAVHTHGAGRSATPEVTEATLRTAALLEELGHRVEECEPVVPDTFPDDFLLYWSMLAMALVRTGRLEHRRHWQPERLDELTLGLDRHCRRHLQRLPGAIRRLRRLAPLVSDFHRRYDVVLTPTLAAATPAVGHLHPAQGYDQLMDRIMQWVAFTPVQNAAGTPAVSLPLETAGGLPLGMMLAADAGREAMLLELAFELEEARPFARIQG